MQYVPDAVTTGESWVLDNEIKTTIVGKIEINCDLHMVYKFATYKDIDYYAFFKDYTFIPFESLTKRTARKEWNFLNTVQLVKNTQLTRKQNSVARCEPVSRLRRQMRAG